MTDLDRADDAAVRGVVGTRPCGVLRDWDEPGSALSAGTLRLGVDAGDATGALALHEAGMRVVEEFTRWESAVTG